MVLRGKFQNKAFTLIELIIVVAILAIIGAISIPVFISFQKQPQLNNASEEILNILKLAQNKTLSSDQNSQYGVYFDTAVPQKYVLFKGTDYVLRDSAYDQVFSIPSIVEFYDINTGGSNQVVFDKLTGTTGNSGNISLRLKEDNTQTKVIYVDNSGVVDFIALSIPSDALRIKDSRHIDLNYTGPDSGTIDTATENVVLTFNGSVVETIPISLHLNNGQFDWTGTYNISGSDQTIRIHTLRLNSPDTRFSIYRDRRLNNASLTIKISGDITGNLAEYSADGLTTAHSSIYVDPNSFAWQ